LSHIVGFELICPCGGHTNTRLVSDMLRTAAHSFLSLGAKITKLLPVTHKNNCLCPLCFQKLVWPNRQHLR